MATVRLPLFAHRKISMNMVDLDQIKHHHVIEEMTDVICTRVQNDDRHFFRTIIAYYMSTIASSMRAKIMTKDRGEVPVNCYAIALATSGAGKGHSTGIIENEFLKGFRERFVEETLPTIAERNLWKLAMSRAAKNGTEEQEEFEGLEKEYNQTGAYPFTFDGGSESAIKQVRQKLLLADIGSINLQIDEIGSKFTQMHIVEAMTTYLELYDQGLIKNKLTKNTSDNKRTQAIEGKTPANSFWFGTPDKLLDGGKVEDAFYSMLETGYARRSLFAFGRPIRTSKALTAKEIFYKKINPTNQSQIDKWATHFAFLADPVKHNWIMDLQDDEAIALIEYQIHCENLSDEMPRYDSIRRAEMMHRYFKVLKLAGTFAFIDESTVVSIDHIHQAMKLVEESGKAFQELLTRDSAHVKLAKHIADLGRDVTHADLYDALPFYKSGHGARQEMMTLATAWGYKNNIIVRKTFVDGIEFFSGEALQETDLNKLILSYSDDYAYNYTEDDGRFDDLHQLTQAPNMHWATHAFEQGHRAEENVIPGFNLLVLDVDGTANMDQTHELLSDYTFMTHTTKRHTSTDHRFRLIFPMNYKLTLDKEDFTEFVKNFLKWLPIQVDEAAMQRSRKWATNSNGTYHINHGELIDVLPFIPKTSRNEAFHERNKELQSLDNLERWFAERMTNGDRNNQMIKFALALVDSGMSYVEVETRVIAFNEKLDDKLPVSELQSTVLVTVARKLNGATP